LKQRRKKERMRGILIFSFHRDNRGFFPKDLQPATEEKE